MMSVMRVPCTPYGDQRPGTSGLRKRVTVFKQGTYLHNFIQAIIDCIDLEGGLTKDSPILVSGDGRYFNDEAARIIIAMLAANGFTHVVVGLDFLLSTPAVSACIRRLKAIGGIILTASHNPGGPDGDFGVKYNTSNGGAAPDQLTERIFERSKSISAFSIAKCLPNFDVSRVGSTQVDNFKLEVVDGAALHVDLLKGIFDFPRIKEFLRRTNFSVLYDAMSGVAGPTARLALVKELGLPESSLYRANPLSDFGGGHPDPNLTYADELVSRMGLGPKPADGQIPDFGAAGDGDMDRNMILGNRFFVTPSDSLAIIAAQAQQAILFYATNKLSGVARSMPTSGAVDRVAKELGLAVYEVPTGWKYFCNLMDSGAIGICGEESFGTGSCHIREKDGMWAVLAWLSILEYSNRTERMSVSDVVQRHWSRFGRNFYSRYDYEGVESALADRVFAVLREQLASPKAGEFAPFVIATANEFTYKDSVDGSVAANQGVRFIFTDGSRIIYRLSGTGSVGATIRVYIERYESRAEHINQEVGVALQPLVAIALNVGQIAKITKRLSPTVIT